MLRKISKEIIDRGLVVSWWCNIRLEKAFDEELAALMAEAGCIGVSAGLECANDRLLRLMNKGITLEGARQACNALSGASIMVHTYLMYAFPTQTAEEVLAALDFVRELFEDGAIVSAYWHRFALTYTARSADAGVVIVALENRQHVALNEFRTSTPSGGVRLNGAGSAHATFNICVASA